MELHTDPAALGGVAGLIAVVAWSIGWLQGVARVPAAARACRARAGACTGAVTAVLSATVAPEPGAASGQDAAAIIDRAWAVAERRELLDSPVMLAELAAAVGAIRRHERIFASHPNEGVFLPAADAPHGREVHQTVLALSVERGAASEARPQMPIAPTAAGEPSGSAG